MKKTNYLWMIAAFFVFIGCNKYDDEIDQLNQDITSVDSQVQELAQQLLALQNWQTQVNADIQSLKTIVSALENKDYVTSVEPTTDGTGYVIAFQNSGTVTIRHGKDGETPDISVKQAEDGLYYWTVDGEWLTDAAGQKIPTTGEDGKDGADAIAPQVRINSTTNLWEISTDGGSTWTSTGVQATGPKGDKGNTGATGAQGPQGEKGDKGDKGDTGASGSDGDDGNHGDSFFSDVVVDDNKVVFTLSDGTTFTLPLYETFANRIQSLTYIPTHTDGKVTMAYNTTSEKWEAELSFFVTPKSVVGNIKQEHISAKGVYTAATRAVNLIDLSVTAFESDATNGTITVTVSGNNLTNFLSGTSDAAVFLIISDGNSEFVSDYVPLTIEQTYTYDQASNTYTVYTAKGLYAWNKALETDLTTNLVLAADITLPNKDLATGEEITETDNIPSGSNWNPYGYYDSSVSDYTMYNGTIDGGGHTISGMRINMDDRTGFVKVLGGSGSIRNLLIDDVVIYSTGSYVAAFAGTNYGGIIENCHVKGEASSIYGQAYYVGGIVGYMNNKSGDAKIIACSNMATVTPVNYESSKYGGIVGIVSYMGSSYKLNVIGCWTKDTNENDRAKDGIGMNDGASVSGVFSFADATAANSKIVEMNQALEDAGYSYRWEAKSGGWPEIKKYGE